MRYINWCFTFLLTSTPHAWLTMFSVGCDKSSLHNIYSVSTKEWSQLLLCSIAETETIENNTPRYAVAARVATSVSLKPGTHWRQSWIQHGRLCWKSTVSLWPRTHWRQCRPYRQQSWTYRLCCRFVDGFGNYSRLVSCFIVCTYVLILSFTLSVSLFNVITSK